MATLPYHRSTTNVRRISEQENIGLKEQLVIDDNHTESRQIHYIPHHPVQKATSNNLWQDSVWLQMQAVTLPPDPKRLLWNQLAVS